MSSHRAKELLPRSLSEFIQDTGCFIRLKRVNTELPENRTELVNYLNSQNENSQRMRKAKCSKLQPRRSTVYQDLKQSKEQDSVIDIKIVDIGTLQDSEAKVEKMLEDPEKLE